MCARACACVRVRVARDRAVSVVSLASETSPATMRATAQLDCMPRKVDG